ncbi:MAG: tetratricopeptide repeat protein, partial [Cyanobacteria bacterium J06628_3]
MARKRRSFFRRIQSFLNLKKFSFNSSSISSFGRRKKRKNIVYYLLLLTVLFTIIGILPVVAQNIPSQSVLQTSASPIQLVQEGRNFYNKGKFNKAIKKLQEAKTIFRESGDKLNLSMTLSNLSLAYQQLGLWDKAEYEITESINLLKSLTDNSKDKLKLLASALEVRGKLKLSVGKPGEALENWKGAASTFNQVGDKDREIRSLVAQSLALQELGLYRETFKILIPLFNELKEQDDSYEKAIIFRRL